MKYKIHNDAYKTVFILLFIGVAFFINEYGMKSKRDNFFKKYYKARIIKKFIGNNHALETLVLKVKYDTFKLEVWNYNSLYYDAKLNDSIFKFKNSNLIQLKKFDTDSIITYSKY